MEADPALAWINPWSIETLDDTYTKAWYEYMQKRFPSSVKRMGELVSSYSKSTLQLSIMFMNLGNMKRTTWVTSSEGKKQIKD